jgi:predicted  nucleic acid-binding Zn-ribbon protein
VSIDPTVLAAILAAGVATGSGVGVPILFRRRDKREREAAAEVAAKAATEAAALEAARVAKERDVVSNQSLMADIQDERNDLRKQIATLREQLDGIDGRYRSLMREIEQQADTNARGLRQRITALETEVDTLKRRPPP